MDFLKSGLKTVLGAPEPGQQPSVAETVERLVERASNSTLLEDRRDACRALKAMSRKYRLEVGAQGLDTLRQILELDKADNETVNYALDTLNNIVSPSQFEEEEDKPHIPMNIGDQFTEMFIKDPHNIQLLLDLLDEYDFRVRLSTVQLLISLLTNRTKDIQEIILDKPMGVSKMMDLLSDNREVIRNETLLLLIKLTKGNANIQKIVAFENAFDRLFEILCTEGYSDGGIIVEDCLLLMLNLLKNNSSNINFFKEGSYIQKMLPMFNIPDNSEEAGWSPQKVSNVHCMLQLVRTLVSPSNSAQIVSNCQKIMNNAGLLNALCNILMASGVPADILTETINTVGEVVRGDATNQEFIGTVIAPSYPPRPAIIVLLMSMVNEKQPFPLRCAVLYCFQCYLYRNEVSQANLVQTLLPSSTDVSSLTSGQILCGGLFSSDLLSNWFSAVALMHALIDNTTQKEQLLRVLLATNIGSTPVSLLHQCTLLLQQTTKLQSKVALLLKRVGLETFTAKLGEVSRHELYNRAAKHPQLRGAAPADVLVDYEFCRLFKSLEGVLIQSVQMKQENGVNEERQSSEADLQQYKQVIRLQDARLSELLQQLEALAGQAASLQSALNDSLAANSLLKDENTLLKAQVSANSLPQSQPNLVQPPDPRIGEYEARIQQLTDEVTRLTRDLNVVRESQKNSAEELEKMKKDQDDLLELLADQDLKLNEYNMKLLSMGSSIEEDNVIEPEENST
ncbi:general vesicular transport factor p115 isoform X2 [Vanessa atalanta]|uniref:general vesicular transport factor p115 isoform X2 n=1 Tax=Vanessa atalanta TaxID=42275 RepID=UPI001FCE0121|nr:general vesicular transport factor p115 isoform X2 [Vanessa atalanta]